MTARELHDLRRQVEVERVVAERLETLNARLRQVNETGASVVKALAAAYALKNALSELP